MHFFENHLSTFMHMKSAIKIAIFYIDVPTLCMSGMRKLKCFIANIIGQKTFFSLTTFSTLYREKILLELKKNLNQ